MPSVSLRNRGTLLLLAVTIAAGPLSNVLLRAGMRGLEPAEVTLRTLGHYGWQVFTTPAVWAGILLRLGFLISSLALLARADYSFVTPVTSISYVLVLFLGHWLLGEPVSHLRWSGALLICAGVVLVGRTPVRTTLPTPGMTQVLPASRRHP
jgi:drug/metabolite transporter (DMT)-like permease